MAIRVSKEQSWQGHQCSQNVGEEEEEEERKGGGGGTGGGGEGECSSAFKIRANSVRRKRRKGEGRTLDRARET